MKKKAKIYKPTKSSMQSGLMKTKEWVLEYIVHNEQINPLMGWQSSSNTLSEVKMPFNSKDDASAACNDYLKVLGYVAVAHSWIKVLEVSYKNYETNKQFYEDKINTAKYYFERVLPRIESHYITAVSGSDYIMSHKFN